MPYRITKMRYKKKYLVGLVLFSTIWYLSVWSNVESRDRVDYKAKLLSTPEGRFVTTKVIPENIVAYNNSNNTIPFLSLEWIHTNIRHVTNPFFLQPRLKLSRNRHNVGLVLGVPTIKRPSNDSYILDTVQSIFEACSDLERKELLVVVSITEPWDLKFETELVNSIKQRFPAQLEEGSLEVIAPYPQFYPDFNSVKLTLGDGRSRVKWRSKQNMDYGFLMMYCVGKANYYLQIEDDLSTTKGFVTAINNTVTKTTKKWVSISFSQLGYIGRLYTDDTLKEIMEYLLKYFYKKPCDWLQYDFLREKVCPKNINKKECDRISGQFTWLVTPTLFQHRGFKSSFQGNINKLQDEFFGGVKKPSFYRNPTVRGTLTTIDVFGQNTLNASYNSKGIFWGKEPRVGDVMEFLYDPPVTLHSIDMMSGRRQNIRDVINDAVVEILPAAHTANISFLHTLKSSPLYVSESSTFPALLNLERHRKVLLPMLDADDRFYRVGEFVNGQVNIKLSPDFGMIRGIRVRFESSSGHWIILSDILLL